LLRISHFLIIRRIRTTWSWDRVGNTERHVWCCPWCWTKWVIWGAWKQFV